MSQVLILHKRPCKTHKGELTGTQAMNCMATRKLSCGPRAVLEAKWHPTTDVLATGRQEEWER